MSKEVAIVDNFVGKIHLAVYANTDDEQAYEKVLVRLKVLRHQLRLPLRLS